MPHTPIDVSAWFHKIYLVDMDVSPCAYGISLSVVEYQTGVPRGDMNAISELLAEISVNHCAILGGAR